MNGATLRLAYYNGKKLDNISAFTKEAHQISDEAVVVKTTHSEKNYKEYNRLLSKAQAVLRKRLKDKHIDADDEDDFMNKEMRIYKVDYVRTIRKKSIWTNTHKLINKAKANIEAVEKGMFGVGH